MKIKHFLKPDWRKIAITIIIFFIISYFYVLFFLSVFCPACAAIQGPNPCEHHYDLAWEPCSCHCGYPDFLTSVLNEIYFPLVVLVTLVTSYILSCLIVWIYDEFRKRKGDYVHIQNINMIMGQQKRNIKKK